MADTTLDQEEVWDDTDLLESWNEAFAEYKKYHSIAAKGGRVLPPPTKKEDTNGSRNGGTHLSVATETNADQQQHDESAESEEYVPPSSIGQVSKSDLPLSVGTDAATARTSHAALPQVLAGSVQDENMKNLMMSWYYAGYYTGLHEGKQQGYASALQQQQGTAHGG